MKPADLQPGHRIPLTRPSYAPWRDELLVVATEPEPEHDAFNDRILVARLGVDEKATVLAVANALRKEET